MQMERVSEALDIGKGVSLSLKLNVQNNSGRAGIKWPTERTEKGKASILV